MQVTSDTVTQRLCGSYVKVYSPRDIELYEPMFVVGYCILFLVPQGVR